jgi:hypothetical protein
MSLLLLLVLIAWLGGLNVLLLVPIAGLSSGTTGIFSTLSLFFALAFTFTGAIFSMESCFELVFDLQSMTIVKIRGKQYRKKYKTCEQTT